MKLALDQTSDYSKRELYNFLHDIPLPEYVKSASLDNWETTSKLDKEAFADVYNKAFPINSKAGVYISNVYFTNKKAELKKLWGDSYTQGVEDRIKQAADVYGISKEVADYVKIANERDARDYKEEYIFVTKEAQTDVSLFPVKTKDDFVKAANVFSKNISKYPYIWRPTISQAFVKKASKYGVDELPDLICKYASMFYPVQTIVKDELKRRINKISEELRPKYTEFIGACDNCKTKDDYFKLAESVYNFEYLHGVHDNVKISSLLGDPVDRFFTLSIEKVAELLDVVEMGGNTFHMNDLQKVSTDIYKEAFGIDIDPKDKVKLAEVLPTMPLSDVSLFVERSGIIPL